MKNGFTLVELLAVIVILAVLALIATPVVLSIIDDAKESAMLRSAEMYLSGVENAVMRENMNSGGNFRPSQCTITIEGNLDCDDKEGIIEVEVNGEKPNNGTIMFENGKIKVVTLDYQSGTIVKNEEGNLVYSDEESGEDSEEETLAPGLYKPDGTFIAWQTLLDDEYIIVENNKLDGYMDDCNRENAGKLAYTTGKLVVADGITYVGGFSCPQGHPHCYFTEIILPDTVTEIESWTFASCYNLTYINIPEGVQYIGEETFGYCESLETINIPSTVTSIVNPFWNSGIKIINYNGTKEEWNAINKSENWNLERPQITVHCTDGDIVIPAWTES